MFKSKQIRKLAPQNQNPLMKARILLLSTLLLLSCSKATETKMAIMQQLKDYPESRVQDIYKSFCQDNLGPEHLIPNPEYAKNYLQRELSGFREDLDSLRYEAPESLYYPVGDHGNYLRVDLSVVLNSQISEEQLLDAFVRSANEGSRISPEEWAARWDEIARVIRKDFGSIPNAQADLLRLDSLVKGGNLIVHHSPEFNAAYHPHYRIISKEIFESELKPLID